eukprot:COSAG06_NODE_2301_length_7120_cov_3.535251_5_plen_78_part_00
MRKKGFLKYAGVSQAVASAAMAGQDGALELAESNLMEGWEEEEEKEEEEEEEEEEADKTISSHTDRQIISIDGQHAE